MRIGAERFLDAHDLAIPHCIYQLHEREMLGLEKIRRFLCFLTLYICCCALHPRRFGVAGILDQEKRGQKDTLGLGDGKGGAEDSEFKQLACELL